MSSLVLPTMAKSFKMSREGDFKCVWPFCGVGVSTQLLYGENTINWSVIGRYGDTRVQETIVVLKKFVKVEGMFNRGSYKNFILIA